MISDELKAAVIVEATKLRKIATKEELDKLDFKSLNPEAEETCIYGQMTGNCFGKRSTELLSVAAIPFSYDLNIPEKNVSLCKFSSFIRGADENWEDVAFSAIETYIYQDDAKNDNLIDFLQGRTDKLVL